MNFELLKSKTNNFLGKIKHKLSAKIWNSYLLTYDQYLKLIKEKIIKIDSYEKLPQPINFRITADPSFLSSNLILYESISKKNGNGQIFIYDLDNKRTHKLPLNESHHYSFPNYYKFNEEEYLTFESNEENGLVIYKIKRLQKNKSIKNFQLTKIKVENSPDYRILDPVIINFKKNYYCFCSSIQNPNETKCIGKLVFDRTNIIKLIQSDYFNFKIPLRVGGKFETHGMEIQCQMQLNEKIYGDGIKTIFINKKGIKLKHKYLKIKNGKYFGPHTLNFSESKNLVLIDLCYESFKFADLILKFKHFYANHR